MMALPGVKTVLFDVDGTLIDSNCAHAETWTQSLLEHGVDADMGTIRPLIGMGGDKLLPMVARVTEDSASGQSIAQRKKELFVERLPTLHPTRGARALVEFLKCQGIALAIATSADAGETSALLQQAGVDDLFPLRTTKDDVAESKPDPDIVHAALGRAETPAELAILVGDTPYDIRAAQRASVRTIALRCGGYWNDDDLTSAFAIFDDPAALFAFLDSSH